MIDSGMVYDDAQKLYDEVAKSGKSLLEEAFNVLFPGSISITSIQFKSQPFKLADIIGVNTTFLPRQEIVRVPTSGLKALKNEVVQTSTDGREAFIVMECGNDTTNNFTVASDLGGPSLANVPLPVSGEYNMNRSL